MNDHQISGFEFGFISSPPVEFQYRGHDVSVEFVVVPPWLYNPRWQAQLRVLVDEVTVDLAEMAPEAKGRLAEAARLCSFKQAGHLEALRAGLDAYLSHF